MMQHKENVLLQPASPAAFCCIKNKKKLKKILKFSILKEEQKKEPKKEPNRNEKGEV